MVSMKVSGSISPGSSPGWGHCVVFLGRTLYSHSVSLVTVLCSWARYFTLIVSYWSLCCVLGQDTLLS